MMTIGKRVILVFAILLLSACNATPAEVVLSPTETTPSQTEAPTPDIALTESPATSLTDEELFAIMMSEPWGFGDIAVPDFLTEEQQRAYRWAHHFFENRLHDYACDPKNQEEYEIIKENDYSYFDSKGLLSNWDDLERTGLSVFTEELWRAQNTFHDWDGVAIPQRIERNGQVYFIEFSRGTGYFYNDNFPDEFYLVEQTEDRISFMLVGHYTGFNTEGNETIEEQTERLKREYEYTLEFPIEMVLTDEGWRFSEFHSALLEEDGPDEVSRDPSQSSDPLAASLTDEEILAEMLSKPWGFGEVSVPDFLTEEQQMTYRWAHFFYNGADECEYALDEALRVETEIITINGSPYFRSQGLLRHWEDFERTILSTFTEELWLEFNNLPEDDGTTTPHRIEKDGFMWYISHSMGGPLYYNKNISDEFYLVEQTEDHISFMLVGHYNDMGLKDGESHEEMVERCKIEFDYTIEFPIEMVLTDEGWRFSEFHSARKEEYGRD